MKFFDRLFRRRSTPASRGFNAAQIGRLTAGWFSTTKSLNEELRGDLDLLRRRGRELVNNNDYASKYVGMVQNNIIGPGGIRLQVRVQNDPGRPDDAANKAIEAAWERWQAVCDVAGKQHFRDLCVMLVGGLPSDGEFLVRIVQGADAGNAFNFALQAIDVDRIDTTANFLHNGNPVKMGVETNAYGRTVAIHIFKAHPSDGINSQRERIRIPAEELIHGFKLHRAEQVRGIPWMAPGMLSLHHLGNFGLSALLAAEHGANHYGFFTTPDAAPPIGEADPVTQEVITTTQPGIYDTLPAGTTFVPHESKYPNEVFGPFHKSTLQRIASGWRVSYHSLGNDLEGVSYSSIRSGTVEERDRWTDDQEWFINVFMERVYRAWLRMSLLSGAITMVNGSALPAAKLEKFSAHEWQARRWEWVDPKGDIEAKILMVKAGLMSPQDLAAAMGYDFNDTMEAIALANDIAERYGVTLPAYQAAPGAAAPAPTPAPAPEPQTA